jgi:hypothetical protein
VVGEVEVVQQVRRVDASFFSLFSFLFSLRVPLRSVLPEIAPLDP